MKKVLCFAVTAMSVVGCGLSDLPFMGENRSAQGKGVRDDSRIGFFSCWMTYDEASRNLTIKAFLRSGINAGDNLLVEPGSVSADGVALQPDENYEYSVTMQQEPAKVLTRKCTYAGPSKTKTLDLQASAPGVGGFDPEVSIAEGLALQIADESMSSDQGGMRVQIRGAGGGAVVGEWGSWQGFPVYVRLTEDAAPGTDYELTAWRGTYLHFDADSDVMAVSWSGEYTSAPVAIALVP